MSAQSASRGARHRGDGRIVPTDAGGGSPSTCEKGPPSPLRRLLGQTECPGSLSGRRIEASSAIGGQGGGMPKIQKMRGVNSQNDLPKRDLFARFGTNPPSSKAPDRFDFHRREGFARRFVRKGWEMALGLRRMK